MSAALKPKHQRLVLLVIALVALVGAGLLAAWALRNQASYFYLPEDIAAEAPSPDRAIRLGGVVKPGSVRTEADGVTIAFAVSDGIASVPVRFAGIVPSLFTEGSGVVAEGRMQADGTFAADNLLAKHDENYVPRELEDIDHDELRRNLEESLN